MTLVGFRIKKLREQQKLNQTKLAQLLGNSQRTISSWEKGVVEPSIEMLIKLATIFDVPSDYLIGIDSSTQIAIEAEQINVLTQKYRDKTIYNEDIVKNNLDSFENWYEAIISPGQKNAFHIFEGLWLDFFKLVKAFPVSKKVLEKIYNINPSETYKFLTYDTTEISLKGIPTIIFTGIDVKDKD